MSTKSPPTHSTGEWRRGTSPLRSLRYGREPLGSSGSHHPAVGFIHTALPSSQVPPIKWLTFESGWIIHPLRSIPITGTSTLLRVGPPLCPASVLSPSWVLHLNFSLIIGTTGSHVPHKSLDQVRATFMPDAAQAVNQVSPTLILGSVKVPNFDSI